MMFFTGLITGILQMLFFDHGLMGASGIVFMLIILSSLTNFRTGRIPLTFIVVAILFIGEEVVNGLKEDNVSQFAHVLGGIIGAVFGFTTRRRMPANRY
jgi:membrane associated rhomboid family serine protease